MKASKWISFAVAAGTFLAAGQVAGREGELKFGVTGAVGSDPSHASYRALTNYIANKVGKKALFISDFNYTQIDNLFMQKQVDVGFLCNTHYARRSKEVGFEVIAAPMIAGYGKPKYQQFIIVHKDSAIKSLEDLEGKTVDLADPLSTTTIYAAYMLLGKNKTISSWFGKVIYSGSHDKTVELVANKLVDAGYIDGYIWDFHEKVRPEYSSKTKVIHISTDFTMPPVVVSATIDKALKEEIKRILLTMHEDPAGREILNQIRVDRFVDIEADDYLDALQIYNRIKDLI